jgi:hypothetical protein
LNRIAEWDPHATVRFGWVSIRFHRLPPVRQEDIILPESTWRLIDRNSVQFFRHADVLLRSGRSLKRGLLFHGEPGTGKPYTAKWLAQSLDGITVILISGEQFRCIKQCCEMARMLAPTLVMIGSGERCGLWIPGHSWPISLT